MTGGVLVHTVEQTQHRAHGGVMLLSLLLQYKSIFSDRLNSLTYDLNLGSLCLIFFHIQEETFPRALRVDDFLFQTSCTDSPYISSSCWGLAHSTKPLMEA